MTLVLYLLLVVASVLAVCVILKHDMQMMQQNSYRNERYLAWAKQNKEYFTAQRIALLLCGLASVYAITTDHWVVNVAILLVCVFVAVSELKKKFKKPLVFTKRVTRLYVASIAICVLLSATVSLPADGGLCAPAAALVCACLSFAVVAATNWLLKPVERHINNSYINDAKKRLAQMPGMKIVGITGSYGKTSTKHYLYRMLSEHYSVLMTPGSFNTPMGVVRTVREMMQPYNEVFIVEMGAKNIGDIKEICDIVHPQMGIVTAVGPQHLESFKTIENVQKTKFELVDALPSDGLAVLNNDFEYVRNRDVTTVPHKRYAVSADAGDYHATNVQYGNWGTRFTIEGADYSIALETRLVGECNISNLMAAVIVAKALGLSDAEIRYAVSKIEQVEHRLNMKHTATGITIIDDAYNSNPDGSRMALDVLGGMTGGKRIVITPGMIELGEKQGYYNELFGKHIAETCDVAIVVGEYNREAILAGIRANGMSEDSIKVADTFAQAQQMMLNIARAGDTVLYENDLPDTFK